jgi:hypothetical protein
MKLLPVLVSYRCPLWLNLTPCGENGAAERRLRGSTCQRRSRTEAAQSLRPLRCTSGEGEMIVSSAATRKDRPMNGIRLVVAAVVALALPAVAVGGANPVPQQFCQVQFVAGGPLYDGVGVTVRTPRGSSMTVCRVTVAPPPETIVMTFQDTNGDVIVITRSGAAIVVFRSSFT